MPALGDLGEYVAQPRIGELRLSPDGSWLAAVVQGLSGDGKKYVSSIWRVDSIALTCQTIYMGRQYMPCIKH